MLFINTPIIKPVFDKEDNERNDYGHHVSGRAC